VAGASPKPPHWKLKSSTLHVYCCWPSNTGYNLTAAISFLEPILDAVRTRLQDVQNQLDSIVYPVLTLPPEMTSEIFIHCLPSEPEIVFPDDAPLLLTRVCRAWRQIAISTPALWATFVAEETDSIPRLAEIAKTWLKRAQKHPLSV
ncbi:hypothetical protein B0H14DRAFT_3548551, partial [Mycena olivaceomarginata]